ncbi:MAG: hypothetical protein GC182_18365 [Rhodopseudomonas sp.]|nr:hypothetical protein [Rhodopseudomonas sp.]
MIAPRPTRLTLSSRKGAGFSLALAATLLVGSLFAGTAPARAADDDVPLDSQILRGVLEAVGLRKDGEAIDYTERAPLVIPPNRTLPPPEKPDAVIANNPAWPKDPDVLRAKEDAKRSKQAFRSANDQQLFEERRQSEAELTPGARKGRRTASGRKDPRSDTASTYGYGEVMSPSQLGYKGGLFDNFFGGKRDDVAQFTGEPPRATLTEPPPGYQTPSPDQPYGLSGASVAPKATDYLGTHGEAK